MDFRRQQRDPSRHLVGIVTVVAVHVLVIYAMMTGLVRTAVDVMKKPLTATIIAEPLPPPPPPPPPPKKLEAPPPPPAYVPPADIQAPAVTDSAPVISAVISTPPPPPVAAPPVVVAPPAPPPPPPPPKPSIRRGMTPVAGEKPEFPRAAIRAGIEKGRVVARVMIDENGNVTDVTITLADPPRVFDRAVIDALRDWKFKPEGEKYVGEVEVNFTLKD